MITRPTDKEKVDRYVGQSERIRKQLIRLVESMAMTLDHVVDPPEERRLRRMINRSMSAVNILSANGEDKS